MEERQQVSFSDLPGWKSDNLKDVLPAFRKSCRAIGKKKDWQDVCAKAYDIDENDTFAIRSFFETHFIPYRIANENGSETGLATGYFEPLLQGSRVRKGKFRTALYRQPDDLLVIDLASAFHRFYGNCRIQGADPAVQQAVRETRPRLRMALGAMFPGKLLLCFDTEMLNQAIAQRIEQMNGVQDVPPGVRRLGPYMCVPYGKIFADAIVPNTVTKTLHVEKCYAPDVRSFTIEEYPDYSPLPSQVRALRSFHRPIILVDDLLHKGYRIEKLDRVFRQERIAVDRILVAVMSGYGRDLMRVQGRRAECEYFIPNLHYWVTESLLYPFIGGDSVAGRRQKERMLPSVNMILPYVYPSYFFDVTETSIRNLSKTALENAMQILRALEREHQRSFSAALTIRRLGEALLQPRLPDKGDCMTFDFSLPASTYLEEDLARLDRICR